MNDRFPFAAALFDMDGVVVDNMPLHRRVWSEFAARYGVHPTADEVRAFDGRRAADIVQALFGELPEAEAKARADAREAYYAEILPTAELPPVPGVRAFLDWLGEHQIPRVLATSATPENVRAVLDRLDLHRHFEAIVAAPDVTRGKPDPEVYQVAAARAGTTAPLCLVCEDALPGVQAGWAAGAAVLGVATSEPPAKLLSAGARWTAPDFRFEAFPWEGVR